MLCLENDKALLNFFKENLPSAAVLTPLEKKKHMENPGHLKPVAESINYQWLMTVGGCSPTLANDLAALEFAFPEITSGPSNMNPILSIDEYK